MSAGYKFRVFFFSRIFFLLFFFCVFLRLFVHQFVRLRDATMLYTYLAKVAALVCAEMRFGMYVRGGRYTGRWCFRDGGGGMLSLGFGVVLIIIDGEEALVRVFGGEVVMD